MKILLCTILLLFGANASADEAREIMKASLLRHAPVPYVYEEQTLVLSNGLGQYSVRTIKHYVRRDHSGNRSLMVVITPAEANGMSVFVGRDFDNGARRGAKPGSSILGSDFLVSDLEDERADEFRYEILPAQEIEHVKHLVLRALPMDNARITTTSATERIIYLREDNLFVSRIDYHDAKGQLSRRQSFRDPHADETGAWRANMILMENLKDEQRTLLKIDRRVHSPDYVPLAVFAGLS